MKEENFDMSNMSELGKIFYLQEPNFIIKEKLNMKLKRNRESARNSRKRKKMYIELLETKVL